MEDFTITGTYTLPSLGKVYSGNVNPDVTIRSMVTADEQKRLNPSDRPYKVMANIIDDCMIDKPNISAYDMCLGDYQYLLHKLRVVTYGTDYTLSTTCPWCGSVNEDTINLDEMGVSIYSDEIKELFELDLPRSKKHITLKMQTPRILDDITVRAKELRKRYSSEAGDSAFLLNIQSVIDTIDGKRMDAVQLEDFVRKLPMMDTNKIANTVDKINNAIGLNTGLECTCDVCGLDYTSPFRVTSEFFRPTND